MLRALPLGRYAVEDDAVAKELYQVTSFAERADLHARIADWFSHKVGNRDETLPIIADHLLRAGKPRDALHAIVEAATEHLKLGFLPSAIDLLCRAASTEAFKISEMPGVQAVVLVSLCQAEQSFTGKCDNDSLLFSRAMQAISTVKIRRPSLKRYSVIGSIRRFSSSEDPTKTKKPALDVLLNLACAMTWYCFFYFQFSVVLLEEKRASTLMIYIYNVVSRQGLIAQHFNLAVDGLKLLQSCNVPSANALVLAECLLPRYRRVWSTGKNLVPNNSLPALVTLHIHPFLS